MLRCDGMSLYLLNYYMLNVDLSLLSRSQQMIFIIIFLGRRSAREGEGGAWWYNSTVFLYNREREGENIIFRFKTAFFFCQNLLPFLKVKLQNSI